MYQLLHMIGFIVVVLWAVNLICGPRVIVLTEAEADPVLVNTEFRTPPESAIDIAIARHEARARRVK